MYKNTKVSVKILIKFFDSVTNYNAIKVPIIQLFKLSDNAK